MTLGAGVTDPVFAVATMLSPKGAGRARYAPKWGRATYPRMKLWTYGIAFHAFSRCERWLEAPVVGVSRGFFQSVTFETISSNGGVA